MDTYILKSYLPESILTELPEIQSRFEINTPLRLAHFLGQCAHESANFTILSENLNYSTAGLRTVFPKYFKDDQTAAAYARNPEKIASRVYANRMGNGPEETADGYKYRGRGCIQLTGKNNYQSFGLSIGADLVSNPDLVKTSYALISAAWFWDARGLNSIADKGLETVPEITKVINGGSIGLASRIDMVNKFYNLLKTA